MRDAWADLLQGGGPRYLVPATYRRNGQRGRSPGHQVRDRIPTGGPPEPARAAHWGSGVLRAPPELRGRVGWEEEAGPVCDWTTGARTCGQMEERRSKTLRR